MEKSLNFSIFKEKIIKTNDLLNVLFEKNKLLDKAQKFNQHLKTKLELCKNENNKLKLRNDALEKNLVSTEKNYEKIRSEHDVLKDDFTKLENEAGKTINNLQINYQLTNQELKECKGKILILEKQIAADTSLVNVQNSPTKTKKVPGKKIQQSTKKKVEKQNVENEDSSLMGRIYEFQLENERLLSENNSLKLRIVKLKEESTHKESSLLVDIKQLKQELCDVKLNKSDLPLLEDDLTKTKYKLNLNEQELHDLKIKYDTTLENKNLEIENLHRKITDIEKDLSKLHIENENLRDENSSYKVEVQILRENNDNQTSENIDKSGTDDNFEVAKGEFHAAKQNIQELEDKNLRESNSTPTDEEVCAILKQMIAPTQLSPMRNLSTLCHRDDRINSPFDNQTHEGESRFSVSTNNGHNIPAVNDNLKNIVTRRRNLLKRRKLFARKKSRQVNLLGALLALKEANINFIISSDSLVPFKNNSLHSPNTFQTEIALSKLKKIDKNQLTTVTKQLDCTLKCCRKSYMILKECAKEEDAPLLGFLEVKNETTLHNNFVPKDRNIINITKPFFSERRSVKLKNSQKNVHKKKKTINEANHADKGETIEDNVDTSLDLYTGHDGLNVEQNNSHLRYKLGSNRKHAVRKRKFDQTRDNRLIRTVETKSRIGSPRRCKQQNFLKNDIDYPSEEEVDKTDDGYASCRLETSFSEDTHKSLGMNMSLQIRKKKRRNNFNMSVIKRKVSVNNELAITNCSMSCLDTVCDQVDENQLKTNAIAAVNSSINDSEIFRKPIATVKSPKTTFKRPVCSTRRSLRLVAMSDHSNCGNFVENNVGEDTLSEVDRSPTPPPLESPRSQISTHIETPKSPTPSEELAIKTKPVLIPLTNVKENVERMPTTKIEVLFNKLIVYSAEEEALNEIVSEFSSQDPEYIAGAILERISVDYHDAPDTKYSPAPLMTDVQRTMLGFMSKLEKSNVIGVFDSYLSSAEQRILTCQELHQLGPITRLYLAICKLQKNLMRMRKLCCDVFYFCGDLAVPFLFMVLTSWTEVLPLECNSKDMPIARVIVQIVLTKDCGKPGYNLLPLKDLLNKFYGYPVERWDVNEFFKELFYEYLRNPVRSSDLALLLYCKNRPEKWVYEKIEEHVKPIVNQKIADNFKATIIILIGNLYNRFSCKSEINYLPRIREWFTSLVTETTPDVVKRSIYLCLNRLKKK